MSETMLDHVQNHRFAVLSTVKPHATYHRKEGTGRYLLASKWHVSFSEDTEYFFSRSPTRLVSVRVRVYV